MLSIGVQDAGHIAGNLQETFVSISVPRHPLAQQMLKSWHKRPADGFTFDQDFSAIAQADPLQHSIAWTPMPDMRDFLVRHVGEALRSRFSMPPEALTGRPMSQLLSEDLFAYQRHICPQILTEDRIETLNVGKCHNGFEYMHYEMMIFRATDTDGTRLLISGLFSF